MLLEELECCSQIISSTLGRLKVRAKAYKLNKKTDSKVGLIKQITLQRIRRVVPEAGLEPARYF